MLCSSDGGHAKEVLGILIGIILVCSIHNRELDM